MTTTTATTFADFIAAVNARLVELGRSPLHPLSSDYGYMDHLFYLDETPPTVEAAIVRMDYANAKHQADRRNGC